MSVAFLFPGQGSQTPRMGLEIAEQSPAAKALLDLASAQTGVELCRLLGRGGRQLEQTEVLQPALTAVSLGAAAVLRAHHVRPRFVAGHSLGELVAWAAGGGINFEDAIHLAVRRGRLMAEQAARTPGSMLALFVGESEVDAALSTGRERGRVYLAAHNGPNEWVIAGDERALYEVAAAFPARRLSTSGPWHAEHMRPIEEPFRCTLARVRRHPMSTRFVCNRTGEVVEDEAQIPDLLAGQLTRPVHWTEALRGMGRAGVTDFVTVGPGRVLRSHVRKSVGDQVAVHATEHPDDLARTLEALGP